MRLIGRGVMAGAALTLRSRTSTGGKGHGGGRSNFLRLARHVFAHPPACKRLSSPLALLPCLDLIFAEGFSPCQGTMAAYATPRHSARRAY